ncbi:purine-binding chemotaxis protein CheW [Patescibacteria group bacterium]|nr:purine-binding chemotaxis protein CheW [Patescibacteria group bacterium]
MAAQSNDVRKPLLSLVLFKIDNDEYAVNVHEVLEVIKSPEIINIPNSPQYVSGFLNLRGNVLSVIDLEKKFGLTRTYDSDKPRMVIIVDGVEFPFGVMVDEVSEVIRVTDDAMQKPPDTIKSKIGENYVVGVVLIQEESAGETGIDNEKEITTLLSDENKKAVLLVSLKEIMVRIPEQQGNKKAKNE